MSLPLGVSRDSRDILGACLLSIPAAADGVGLHRSALWRMVRRRRVKALVLPGGLLRVTAEAVAHRLPHGRTSAMGLVNWWRSTGSRLDKVEASTQPESPMDTTKNQPAPLLTVQEAATWAAVHPKTVRRWLRDGVLPGVRLHGRAVRIAADALAVLCTPYEAARHSGAPGFKRRG